VARTAGVPAP